ncbi:MAG: hypothetical protein CHKLHMKO_00696 [Candidatus Argoarchaeum ethanivorans]|uniref:EF-hand domain-containing protein n=1 Tax=Candidatus Argoarchaeum ethanivorans TaxID=2608793 RepID=A0A811TFS6_9EURY|nr:MAG: hypothetical protein CHKLHMKO_00696 [Candidatus Argoarchaeum ethanivorans]
MSDKLKETFASFDSDKDGKLSKSERQTWWDWVEENVEYMTDKFDDYTKMPDETVYEEGGDCEDMAVLNAEFYKSHGYEVQIGIVATEGSDGYNHALTRVKVGDEWVIVDNAAGSELGDTIKVQEELHRVDYSLEKFFRATVHPIKVRNIDGNVNGYDIDDDGKADIVTRDSDQDGVVDTYEFYKDGKKIQERHFEDGELIKTDYYGEGGDLISGEMLEPEEVSPKVVETKSAYQLEVDRIWDETGELWDKAEDIDIKRLFAKVQDKQEDIHYRHRVIDVWCGYDAWINRDKVVLDLYKKAYNDEQKVTPPEGAEYLHNCYLNHLKYFIEFCEYDIEYFQHSQMEEQYIDIASQLDPGDPQHDYYIQLYDEQRELSMEYMNKKDERIKQSSEYSDKIRAEYEKYYPRNSTEPAKPQ